MSEFIPMNCQHEPKTVKKIGVILGQLSEVLVCNSCKLDPDFSGFKEEVLQN